MIKPLNLIKINSMKSYAYLFLLCLLIGPLTLFGQIVAPKPPVDQIRSTVVPTPGYSIGEATFVNPMADKDAINWNIKISHKGGLDHAIDMEDELVVLKAEKTASKIAAEELNGGPTNEEERSVVGVEPIVLATFEDVTDTGTPPDNDMAISDNGFIVSVVNSSMSYLNDDGTVILSDYPFSNLVSGLNVSSFLFDPKVIYDPVADRFILVVLAGSTPNSSTVVVGFSVSENPSDGWNLYTFNGAAFAGNWFDFPNVGISAHDLVITGNLFNANDNFQQSLVIQIDKSDGYAGVDLDWEFFNNVTNGLGNDAFTIVPAPHGFDDEYGPGMFMVSNNSFAGSQIYLYEITDSVNANQNINVFTISTPYYEIAGNGLQLNSDATIGTGDCRVKNAYYANGKVVFCFHYDGFGGYSAIRVHRLDVSSLSIQTANHNVPLNDIGYPTVIPFGLDSLNEDVMIGYLQTSSSIYPQICAISLGEDNIFGPPIVVKNGESPITSLGATNTQRWGDYSGGGRRHNATYRSAWFVGCYGQSSDYGNWIVELSDAPNGLPPLGDFEGSPRVGEVPVDVIFNDLSFNGVEDYEWTFEGGSPATSTESNPLVTYADPGKYDVTLIVSNAFGSDTIFKEEYISARLLPLSDYEADVTLGEAPLTVNFTNLASNGETFIWAFPGGNPSTFTGETPPPVVYAEPGAYNTNLTVENSFGTDFDVRLEYIVVEESTSTSKLEVDELKVYPNPVVDVFSVSFFVPTRELVDISLVDATGRTVKHLFHDRAKGGNNVFSFNKNALSSGVYFLIIKNKDQKIIKNEKIIIGQ